MFCCLKTQQHEKQEDGQNHDELQSNSDSDEASPKQTPKKLLPEHNEYSSKTSRTETLTTDETSTVTSVTSDQVDAVQVGFVQVVVGNDPGGNSA